MVDSLSRLKYYELYETPKPEKSGYKFNKPIMDGEEVVPQQPPGSAYEDADEINLFSILLDLQEPAREEISELQSCLKAKLSVEKLQEAQSIEYANILKAVRKHNDRLAHLYVQNADGLLFRIIHDNNTKHEALMVPKEMTKIILFEAHEVLIHPGQLKMYMFI